MPGYVNGSYSGPDHAKRRAVMISLAHNTALSTLSTEGSKKPSVSHW